jgi:hypothetical protein
MSPSISPLSEETKRQNKRNFQDIFFRSIEEALNWLTEQRLLAADRAQELLNLFSRLHSKKPEDLALMDMAVGKLDTANVPVEVNTGKKLIQHFQSALEKAANAYRAFIERAPEELIGNITKELSQSEEGREFIANNKPEMESIIRNDMMPIMEEGVREVISAPSKEVAEEKHSFYVEKAVACFAPLNPQPVVYTVIHNNTKDRFSSIVDRLALLYPEIIEARNELLKNRPVSNSQNVVVFPHPADSAGVHMLRGALSPYGMSPRPSLGSKLLNENENELGNILRPTHFNKNVL